MLISLNWLRDFVDLPENIDVAALAERFTMTCAEVEGVERIEVGARGLIAARIVSQQELAGTRNLKHVVLDVGGEEVETVSAAPELVDGALVVYAPPGSRTKATGNIGTNEIAGIKSEGMILPGSALGIAMSVDEAIYCPPGMSAGEAIEGKMLDDWVIEVDNKSITHRPDLWGHYGIAREIAAMLQLPLKPYAVADLDGLTKNGKPEIEIRIDNPDLCPRYSGLRIGGLKAQAAPLWLQTRLGHVGMRPIDCLVDLSNYIMAELGQPTHAFDGDRIQRIEVAVANAGSEFTTLDGVKRELPENALMIQCAGESVALAGIMGGLETEVSEDTTSVLLESANFEAACIRRCASAIGLRTDASARFEKSLDPANTVLAIQRFVQLAEAEFPEMEITSRLSDCYPKKAERITVDLDPEFVQRYLGHEVSVERMESILTAIEFGVEEKGSKLQVAVPSFRATKDISIEADIIEEIARYVGYDNIEPVLPEVTVRRFTPNVQHRIERNSLRQLCLGMGYSEVHLYIWYDDSWLKQLGFAAEPSIELRNPSAAGQSRLRQWLLPGLLQAVDRNRLHSDEFKLCEIGSVFPGEPSSKEQKRRLALVSAKHGKGIEDDLFMELKGELDTWSWQLLGVSVEFVPVNGDAVPAWAHGNKSAGVRVGGKRIGQVSVVPLSLRRRIDEHMSTWAIAWAELDLEQLGDVQPTDIRLKAIPEHPEVELDFSLLVDATSRFGAVNEQLSGFAHKLVRRITYVDSYEGKSVPEGKRSLTYRLRLGAEDRTLVDDDMTAVRKEFQKHVVSCGFELR